MAPRPHNSGHYSIDACDLSQFELQVRAMTGAPLVAPRLHSPCVMLNLLGDLWRRAAPREPDWRGVLALPGAHLHLYGKREARPGRKMGHLTLTAASAAAAEARRRARPARRLGLADWPRRRRPAAEPVMRSTVSTPPRSIAPPALIAAGELVAFPTETVYGLGARADNDAAVARIFALKGRPTGASADRPRRRSRRRRALRATHRRRSPSAWSRPSGPGR